MKTRDIELKDVRGTSYDFGVGIKINGIDCGELPCEIMVAQP
jgi:hypothetical protein